MSYRRRNVFATENAAQSLIWIVFVDGALWILLNASLIVANRSNMSFGLFFYGFWLLFLDCITVGWVGLESCELLLRQIYRFILVKGRVLVLGPEVLQNVLC